MEVEELEVSYEKGKLICITEDEENVIKAINELGYKAEYLEDVKAKSKNYKGVIAALVVLLGLYLIIKNTIGFNSIPNFEEQVSYPILFLLGIATSLHCLSMCGGIVISQSVAFKNPIKSTFQYNAGRVIAYTVVGGIVGGIGFIISFSPTLKCKPVNWVIRGEVINGCNNEIVILDFGISQEIKENYNIIKFTPQEEGELGFSCWMGMLDGKFIVVDDINNTPDDIGTVPPPTVNCCTE